MSRLTIKVKNTSLPQSVSPHQLPSSLSLSLISLRFRRSFILHSFDNTQNMCAQSFQHPQDLRSSLRLSLAIAPRRAAAGDTRRGICCSADAEKYREGEQRRRREEASVLILSRCQTSDGGGRELWVRRRDRVRDKWGKLEETLLGKGKSGWKESLNVVA